LLIGKSAIISTPDEWIFWKGRELGFQQQVMFANTSDWRFDTPEENYYVRFIEKATRGELDEALYDAHLRPIKELSDKWWARTMKRFGGALPVPMVKHWGELMGLRAGHVRPPLADLTSEERGELGRELEALRPRAGRESAAAPSASLSASTSVRLAGTSPQERGPGVNGAAQLSGMMLMVSVQNLAEALEAERGGADIVDVKNLQEALVGSGHPLLVQEVRDRIPPEKHVSVTLGVVPNQPGTVAMAVYAAAVLHATSVKVGFVDTDYATAVEVLREARRALAASPTKLIGSLFADNHLYGGLDPLLVVRLARDGECDGFLIDTLTKDGRNLFDFMPEAELREVVFQGKELGMSTALSGHLKLDNLDELARINPDIVGVRGAVCMSGDRATAVAWEAVAEFKRQVGLRKTGAIDVFGEAAPIISNGDGWVVIDGRGKSCAGIIASLTTQVGRDKSAFIEVIIPDVLNTYDVIFWAEKGGHRLLTQRKEADNVRLLIQP
jgi:uncharacterized protein (UPF0264 family)